MIPGGIPGERAASISLARCIVQRSWNAAGTALGNADFILSFAAKYRPSPYRKAA
ncbi:hypothetical protein J6590_007538 [Homalodisca vitripennis]|nr:hypothetical protein J6590_007538 [Homalodisca vitripennis]